MSFIINRVFPRYRVSLSIENKIREFEIQCAEKCQNLTPREFKRWLEFEVDLELLKSFSARKCNYRTTSDLTIHEINQCAIKITEYIYRRYRSNYFTSSETTHIRSVIDGSDDSDHEEDQSFEDEMVHLLQSMRNGVTIREAPTSEMMVATLENDMRSAMIFYDVMLSINSRRETMGLMGETMGPRRKFDIELEESKEEEKEIECFVCLESISNVTCIKQNCSHECCATCLIKTINVDKRPQSLCAMCRTPIEKLIVKTIDLKNQLNELYN
jgi:hypothetical protein